MKKLILLVALFTLVACPTTSSPEVTDAAVPSPPTPVVTSPPVPELPPPPSPEWLFKPRPPVKGVLAAGARPPIIPGSWTVPAWFIDPSNSSGVASDTNTCTTSGAPCSTYAEIAARWGTYSPRIRQNTTITFLSSHTDNSDPVYLRPYLENTAFFLVTGTATQIASVALGSVTAKNRATPQLLQADLGASGAVDQFLINTTRANSRAFAYKVVAGTVFSITQPLAVQTPPVSFAAIGGAGNENDAWANTDTVTLNALSAVNLVDVEPIITDLAPSFTRQLYITNLTVFDPASNDFLTVNQNVKMIDVRSNRGIGVFSSINTFSAVGAYNVDLRSNFIKPTCSGIFLLNGGAISSATATGCAVSLDGDVIINTGPMLLSSIDNSSGAASLLGLVYVETGKSLAPSSGQIASKAAGSVIVWGPGSIRPTGNAHLTYPSGANQAAAAFLLTGAFQINGSTTACGSSNANNPNVINCGITINAANLDAAQGTTGFGGNAFVLGGASISNF